MQPADIELGRLTAQIPQRHVDPGHCLDRHALITKKIQLLPRPRIDATAKRWVEPQNQRLEAQHHFVQDLHAQPIDRVHQSFSDESLVGFQKAQDATRRVNGEDGAYDGGADRQIDDNSA